MTAPASARVRASTHRLIASRFPPIGVFDDLTQDKDDLVVAFLLESATNDRLGILSGRLSLLPPEEMVQGPGATLVMGGLTREDVKRVSDKVPVLGNLPGVGRLFRSKGESSQKRNLLIFVTANLVTPGGALRNRAAGVGTQSAYFENPVVMKGKGEER